MNTVKQLQQLLHHFNPKFHWFNGLVIANTYKNTQQTFTCLKSTIETLEKCVNFEALKTTQLATFTCSKTTIQTLEKGAKYVQSKQ